MTSRKSYQVEKLEALHDHNIDVDRREIFISPHCEDCGVDCLMSAELVRNIRFLNNINQDPILIHIGTCGGDWNYGMMIYDAISNSESRIVTISYAHARSMSSIIPQAADLRIITSNADFMIHEGTIDIGGTTKAVKYNVAWNSHLSQIMLELYAEKCQNGSYFKGWSTRKIATFLKKKLDQTEDWYMSAEDAVEYGFMDGVLGETGYEDVSTIMAIE